MNPRRKKVIRRSKRQSAKAKNAVNRNRSHEKK